MKKTVTLFLFLISITNSFSQDSTPQIDENSKQLVLDEAPIYPGCKRKKTEIKRKKCMSDKVSRYISKHYNVKLVKDLNLPAGDYTVTIAFKLSKNGNIIEAKAKGPHVQLETEAIRVINSLPKIIPGKINGEPVIIPYSIPIYLSSY